MTLLPTLAALRERPWGPDVLYFARNEIDRISVVRPGDEISVADIVQRHLAKTFRPTATSPSPGNEVIAAFVRQRRYETPLAEQIEAFAASGQRHHLFDAERTEAFTAEDAPHRMQGLARSVEGTVYLRFADTDLPGWDGLPLDGFIVQTTPADTSITVTCMPTTPPTWLQAPLIDPVLWLPPGDDGETLAERMRATMRERLRNLRETSSRGDWETGLANARDEVHSLTARVHEATNRFVTQQDGSADEIVELQDELIKAKRTLQGYEDSAGDDDLHDRLDALRMEAVVKFEEASALMDRHADAWAALIGGGLREAAAGRGRAGYPEGAPANLVAKAMTGAAGARKADQQLVRLGYARVTLHGSDEDARTPDDVATTPPIETTPEPDGASSKSGRAIEATGGTGQARDLERPRIDPRAAKRLAKKTRGTTMRDAQDRGAGTYDVPHAASPIVVDPTTSAIQRAETGDDQSTAAVEREDPDRLLERLDDVVRRTTRDLPALDGRNWEAAFPPALAAMVMRRAKVESAPRETSDATRRRLASDILPRLSGLPEFLARLRVEEKRHPQLRRATTIASPTHPRPLDETLLDAVTHPLLVEVRDDASLLPHLLFPGVTPSDRPEDRRTTVVRAWREAGTLHLQGIVHAGCLIGMRRVEIPIATGEATFHDGDADADAHDQDELARVLRAVLGDAVLGPVDDADAWMFEERPRTARARNRQDRDGRRTTTHDVTNTGDASEIAIERETSRTSLPEPPSSEAFETWENVSAPWKAGGDDADIGKLRKAFATNAVARVVLRTWEKGELPDRLNAAAARHLAALAATTTQRIDVVDSPDIDDSSLERAANGAGVVILTDRAFLDHAPTGLVAGTPLRDRPVAVLWRIDGGRVETLVIQVTHEERASFACWTTFPVAASAADDDLAWYLRGTITQALGLISREDATTSARAGCVTLTARPEARRSREPRFAEGFRQGPIRAIAQIRLAPERLTTALGIVERWFDATAAKHGAALIEDRRDEGEWTLSHASVDRGVRSVWSVTVRMSEEHAGAIDVLVRTTLATAVKPALPAFVRDVAEATRTTGPDGLLETEPRQIVTRANLLEFLRELQSPTRVLPILLLTADRNGEFLRRPQDVARQALGVMTVVSITPSMTYELTDALGQEFRTFGGAARVFQPGFDPDADEGYRHPRISPDVNAARVLADQIARATSATLTRYPIQDLVRADARRTSDETSLREEEANRKREREKEEALAEAARAEAEEPSLPFSAPEEATAPEVPDETDAAGSDDDGKGVASVAVEATEDRIAVPDACTTAPDKFGTTDPGDADAIAASDPSVTRPPASTAKTDRRHERGNVGEATAAPPESTAEDVSGHDQATRRDGEAGSAAPAGPPSSFMPTLDIAAVIEAAVSRRMETAFGRMASSIGMPALVERIDALAQAVAGVSARSSETVDQRDERIAALQDELAAERAASAALLDEAEAERGQAVAQVALLRQALNDRRRGENAGSAYPADLKGLGDWLETNVLPNIVIASKAWREMRRVRYGDMERLCRALKLLDGPYIDMRAGIDGARDRWEEGLRDLRLDAKVGTKEGMSIRGGAEYSFRHEGAAWNMDRHLRGTESIHNETDRLLRIYYCYDKEQGRVLIGHMPTHLTTSDS